MKAKPSNLPDHVIKALMHSDYDYSEAGGRKISVTSLIDDPHYVYLRNTYANEVTVQPEDNFWIMFGNLVHTIIERGGKDVMSEFRLYANTNVEFDTGWHAGKGHDNWSWEISGQVDAYDPVTKTLYDNKVTTKWTLQYNPKGKSEHIKQLNIYAWLMRLHGIHVQNLKLIYFIRDLEKRDKEGNKFDSRDIVVVDVPMWKHEDTEALVMEYLQRHIDYDKDIDTSCSPESRWAKPDTYAIVNPATNRALPNCASFDTYAEASKVFADKGYSAKGYKLEFRQGRDIRCEEYCNYRDHCVYWRNKI
jgi:hypothetical protein